MGLIDIKQGKWNAGRPEKVDITKQKKQVELIEQAEVRERRQQGTTDGRNAIG